MQLRVLQALLVSGLIAGCGQSATGKAVAPFKTTTLASFDQPFAMAFLPDGAVLVTEKPGHLRYWRRGQATVDVANVPAVKMVEQGGLLDVALSPGFATDGRIYLTYSSAVATTGTGLTLATAIFPAGPPRLQGLTVLFKDIAGGKGGQFGARIAFAPDGKTLFLTSGERQRFTPAQDAGQPLGKILHLNLDGSPAADNPGAGQAGAPTIMLTSPSEDTIEAATATGKRWTYPRPNVTPAQTWTSGHRNPYGLAFDAEGRLWETEMGPKGGDELNLIERGKNYGWPLVSEGDNYNGKPIARPASRPDLAAPKLFWKPSISPGGLMIYRGAKWPQWQGDAFLPALSAEALIRVHLAGTTATKADQWPMGFRVRAVQQDAAGNIYVLEDGAPGRLMRLDPKP